MPRFAANLSTMFADRPFAERIEAAAAAGFAAVECQFPYEASAAELRGRLAASKLELRHHLERSAEERRQQGDYRERDRDQGHER